MIEKKVLSFRSKTPYVYPTLAVFPNWQPGAINGVARALLAAGDPQAWNRLENRCHIGRFEDILESDISTIPKAHALTVHAKYLTKEVLKAIDNTHGAQHYALHKLQTKIAICARDSVKETFRNVSRAEISSENALARMRKWRNDGIARIIEQAAGTSFSFSTQACGSGPDAPSIYVAFCAQTLDNQYMIDLESTREPYTCTFWNGKYVAVPRTDARAQTNTNTRPILSVVRSSARGA